MLIHRFNIIQFAKTEFFNLKKHDENDNLHKFSTKLLKFIGIYIKIIM